MVREIAMRKPLFITITLLSALVAGCAGDPDLDRRPAPAGVARSAVAPEIDVVFSPQPPEESHNARVERIIGGAERSIDVAMYSFTDAGILSALGEAVDRGVRVRFLFEQAAEDRKLRGSALRASKSGQLELRGVDVRYVNKIMHHKLVIVDGPRDDLADAFTAYVATGSANWSRGAATRYDENTLFVTGHEELTLRLQAEFNLLWEHSRDLVADASLPFELSGVEIDEAAIPDDPGFDALFTSANFTVSGDTFSSAGTSVVSDEIVRAIEGARESIDVASGHLRSRPIAEALMAKKASDPGIAIRVYLDGQEYTSRRRPSHFGYPVGRAGIDVRYKLYSYRWDASYAKQMHHKYLIFDGSTLYTGTYNLSDNAEYNTFENMLVFRGPEFSDLVRRYRENFEEIWETGRAEGRYDDLSETVQTAPVIPLVFEPMALSWQEVTGLKALIRDNCPAVNSPAYRSDPAGHKTCPRP